MSLYNTSALFNQNMSEDKQTKFVDFYKKVFSDFEISKIHDCTIGAGGTTLPLAKIGYEITGSDLSENLVNKAKENFALEGFTTDLFAADLREIHNYIDNDYDCVISTGNSLAHVNNEDVKGFIENVSKELSSGGLIYIDTRNWDKTLVERPIFKARDPMVMSAEEHVSLYQIWNWHDDNSVDFIFVTSTDKNGKHVNTSYTYAPRYYPFSLDFLINSFEDNNMEIKGFYDVDNLWLGSPNEDKKIGDFHKDFQYIVWYGILAQKK